MAVPGRNRTLFCCIFQCITAFEVLQCRSSIKVGANTCCVNASSMHEFNYAVRMNPTSSVLQHFKCHNLADTLNKFSDRSHWASLFNPVLASAHWCLQLIICIASWAVKKGVPCKRKSTCMCKLAACGSAVFTLE